MKFLITALVFTALNIGVEVSYLQDRFEEQFKTTVATPYLLGMQEYYKVLDHITTELTSYDPSPAQQVPQPISKEFIEATNRFAWHVSNASKGAHDMYTETDQLLAMQIRMIKNVSKQINQNDDQIYQLSNDIQRKEYNARATKLEVEAKKTLVDTALDQVKNLEAQFYKAQNRCVGKRRLRRGVGSSIGKWFVGAFATIKEGVSQVPKLAKIAGNAIYQGFCEFLNLFTRRIRRAKTALEAAESQLSNAIESWNSANVEMAYLEESKRVMIAKRASLQSDMDTLSVKKVQYRTSLNEIAGLEHQMQLCVEALREVESQAHSVRNMTQLAEILEPAKIVDPMVAVADLVVLMDEGTGLPMLSAEKVAVLKNKLTKLIQLSI